MKSFAVQGLVFAAGASAHDALFARDVVNIGPSGSTCPAFPTTTVQVQPALYSEYIPYNTIIDPFRDGHPVTVLNAPTTVLTFTYLTTTIYPVTTPTTGTTSTSSSGTDTSLTSSGVGPTGTASTASGSVSTASGSTGTSSGSASTASGATSTVSGSASTASGSTSTVSGSASSASGSSSTASGSGTATSSGQTTTSATSVTLASPTSITSTTATTATPSFGNTTTSAAPTPTGNTTLTFGDGLPPGRYANLPNAFVLLAISNVGGGRRKREYLEPRQNNAAAPATIAKLADAGNLAGGVSQDNCDQCSPLVLLNGRLVSNGKAIARAPTDTAPTIGFLDTADQVNTTFYFNNGAVEWIDDVLGAATFYDCSGSIIAQFGNVPRTDCTQVAFGAVSGQSCVDHIRQNGGTPNPNFDQPVSSTTTASTSTATSAPTSSGTVIVSSTPLGSSTSVATPVSTTSGVLTTSGAGSSSDASPVSTSSGAATTSALIPTSVGTSSGAVTTSALIPTSSSNATVITTTASDTTAPFPTGNGTSTTTSTVLPSGGLNNTAPVSTAACEALSDPYTAPNSKQYDLDCDGYYAVDESNTIQTVTVSYFAACLDLCSAVNNCAAVDWITDDSSVNFHSCYLLSSATDQLTGLSGYNSGVLINNGTAGSANRMKHRF